MSSSHVKVCKSCWKTHVHSSNYCSQKGADNRKHTWILAPGRPSVKDNVPHAPAQLRLARTHGTKRKRRRDEADLPVTGGRINWTSSPKPPTHIYVYVDIYKYGRAGDRVTLQQHIYFKSWAQMVPQCLSIFNICGAFGPGDSCMKPVNKPGAPQRTRAYIPCKGMHILWNQ